jgi:hypothetical protein
METAQCDFKDLSHCDRTNCNYFSKSINDCSLLNEPSTCQDFTPLIKEDDDE